MPGKRGRPPEIGKKMRTPTGQRLGPKVEKFFSELARTSSIKSAGVAAGYKTDGQYLVRLRHKYKEEFDRHVQEVRLEDAVFGRGVLLDIAKNTEAPAAVRAKIGMHLETTRGSPYVTQQATTEHIDVRVHLTQILGPAVMNALVSGRGSELVERLTPKVINGPETES